MTTSLAEVFENAFENASDVVEHFLNPFFPSLQQETINRLELISQFPEDPSKIFTFFGDVADLMGTGTEAHFTPFIPPEGEESSLYGTINDAHLSYFDSYMDALGDSSSMEGLLEFLASPMSGIILGIFTPYIGAGLALVDDTMAIIESLGNGEIFEAFQIALSEPADFLDALLNGYGPVEVSIPVSAVFPGTDSDDMITSINLGGLFSQGGSLFNSLGIDGGDSAVSGVPFGEFGSLVSIQEGIAVALGWDGDGAPLDALGDIFG